MLAGLFPDQSRVECLAVPTSIHSAPNLPPSHPPSPAPGFGTICFSFLQLPHLGSGFTAKSSQSALYNFWLSENGWGRRSGVGWDCAVSANRSYDAGGVRAIIAIWPSGYHNYFVRSIVSTLAGIFKFQISKWRDKIGEGRGGEACRAGH